MAALALMLPGAASAETLHEAAKAGHMATIEALVQAGTDLEARDDQGFTALHIAAGRGRTEAIAALLAAGADVGARTERRATVCAGTAPGSTPLGGSALVKR